jgi:hypothetical protein
MSCTEFKIVLGNRAARDDELDAVSEITVEQATGMSWEATIKISINVDEKGIWNITDKDFADPQFRARIEVKPKNSFFVPLIDGPIVQNNIDLKSEPGLSSMELVINDDSILLNKNQEILQFIFKKDSEIAQQIFHDSLCQFNGHQIEQTKLPPDIINFYGTRMQLLHKLAARNYMYAYVLPGEEPGNSIGCFNSHQPLVLKNLILLGENRNIESLNVRVNLLTPSIVKDSNINPKKSDVESQDHSPDFSASERLGDNLALRNDGQVACNVIRPSQKLLHPSSRFSHNTEQMAKAQAKKSGYLILATGELLETASYPQILTPYNFITVEAGSSPHSGKYFITGVTHKITLTNYTQSFTLARNAYSDISKTVEMGMVGL